MSGESVTLCVPGVMANVRHVRRWLQSVLSALSASPEATADLVLAITELCTNIIRHGYGATRSGDIEIQLTKSGASISVTVLDTAPVFIPEQVLPPPPETLPEGGYGLFLIESLMDEINYENLGTSGNRILLVKHDQP